MTNFSDVSSLYQSSKSTNQRKAQRERGRVTVLIIFLIIIVTFIAVAVGITLSYVTKTDITRLHVIFSVPRNDTIFERGSKSDEQTGTVFCEKITQAIYSTNWTGHFITCRSTVFRNELDELHCSIVLDCTSCRRGTNDVDNIKQIVIRVIEGSSGGNVKSVNGESVKHRPNITKDRSNTTKDRPDTTKDRPNTIKDRPNATKNTGLMKKESMSNKAVDTPSHTHLTKTSEEPEMDQNIVISDPPGTLTSVIPGVVTRSEQQSETVPRALSSPSQTTRVNDITENTIGTRQDDSLLSSLSPSSWTTSKTTTRTMTDVSRPSSTELSTDSDMNSWDKLFSKIMKHDVSFG